MASFIVKIIDPIGLHARPASIIVKEANSYESNIKIIVGDREANLKSLMNVMALGIKTGQTVKIEAKGHDAEIAIKNLKETFITNKLSS